MTSGSAAPSHTPLESTIPVQELRAAIGLPDYIATDDPNVARAIGILWAARFAEPQLARSRPIDVAVFGGVAVRLLCPSSNPGGELSRSIGDVDIITSRRDSTSLIGVIVALHGILGSRFWHGITASDQMFNNLRGGKRYRLHCVVESSIAETGLALTPVDLFVDRIEFCHQLPLQNVFRYAEQRLHTIGAVEVILSKLQYIRGLNEALVPPEERHRVLGVLTKNTILVGPEEKDLLDVSAILNDCRPGDSRGSLDLQSFRSIVRRDWRLAKTVELNLQNERGLLQAVEARGASGAVIDRITSARLNLLDAIGAERQMTRKPIFTFGRTWWQPVEDV